MQKIKKDDQVIVITGKDKGKSGVVTSLLDDGRLYVSGVNMITRHPQGARPTMMPMPPKANAQVGTAALAATTP